MRFRVRASMLGCLSLALSLAAAAESRADEKPAPRIHFKRTQLDAKFRSEGAAVGDFNHDGKLDI